MGKDEAAESQRVNESQQECGLNEDKNLISKIHKSAGAQQRDKETECWSTFPHRWGARGGQPGQSGSWPLAGGCEGGKERPSSEAGMGQPPGEVGRFRVLVPWPSIGCGFGAVQLLVDLKRKLRASLFFSPPQKCKNLHFKREGH